MARVTGASNFAPKHLLVAECEPGSSVSAGLDTRTRPCPGASVGQYVEVACIAGDTVLDTCSERPPGHYVRAHRVMGSVFAPSSDATFSKCSEPSRDEFTAVARGDDDIQTVLCSKPGAGQHQISACQSLGCSIIVANDD